MYTFNREEYNKRMEWYLDARFGMFIHWGLYSIPARGEWVRSEEEIPKEAESLYGKGDCQTRNPLHSGGCGQSDCKGVKGQRTFLYGTPAVSAGGNFSGAYQV